VQGGVVIWWVGKREGMEWMPIRVPENRSGVSQDWRVGTAWVWWADNDVNSLSPISISSIWDSAKLGSLVALTWRASSPGVAAGYAVPGLCTASDGEKGCRAHP
jgi:hypothetical protein